MKKRPILVVVCLLVLIACIIHIVKGYGQPVTLDVEYINSDVLTGTESVDEMIFVGEMEQYVACLCVVGGDELMLLILENNDTYDMQFRHSFSLSNLTSDPYTVMTDDIMFTDTTVYYNVYLNPSNTTVEIKGTTREVNTITYRGYTLGFWCFEGT